MEGGAPERQSPGINDALSPRASAKMPSPLEIATIKFISVSNYITRWSVLMRGAITLIYIAAVMMRHAPNILWHATFEQRAANSIQNVAIAIRMLIF